jgi:hypothetical protein
VLVSLIFIVSFSTDSFKSPNLAKALLTCLKIHNLSQKSKKPILMIHSIQIPFKTIHSKSCLSFIYL